MTENYVITNPFTRETINVDKLAYAKFVGRCRIMLLRNAIWCLKKKNFIHAKAFLDAAKLNMDRYLF